MGKNSSIGGFTCSGKAESSSVPLRQLHPPLSPHQFPQPWLFISCERKDPRYILPWKNSCVFSTENNPGKKNIFEKPIYQSINRPEDGGTKLLKCTRVTNDKEKLNTALTPKSNWPSTLWRKCRNQWENHKRIKVVENSCNYGGDGMSSILSKKSEIKLCMGWNAGRQAKATGVSSVQFILNSEDSYRSQRRNSIDFYRVLSSVVLARPKDGAS